ncbi:MAG: DUF308 domain-containing protein [Clostridia bacterium]|nr:DUF308 domain-containing protein [Clostridia bacterium]
MKKFLKNANSGIICLIEIIVGILLLLDPHAFISYILIIAGAFIAISGVISLIKYFASKPEESEKGGLTSALVSLTIGAFLIIKNGIATEWITIITIVFGAAILYTGYQKLEKAVDKMRNKQYFLVSLISALVTVIFAVLIIFVIPDKAIWLFIGISLVVEAAIDLADMIVGAIKAKNADKKTEAVEAASDENEASESEE